MLKKKNANVGQDKSFAVKDEDFIKAKGSWGFQQNCVSVAIKPEGAAVRDTKDVSKATQFYTKEEFQAFVNGCKAGEFDIV